MDRRRSRWRAPWPSAAGDSSTSGTRRARARRWRRRAAGDRPAGRLRPARASPTPTCISRWYAESLRARGRGDRRPWRRRWRGSRARAEQAPPGAWITGSGWNHNVWGSGRASRRAAPGPGGAAQPRCPEGQERPRAVGELPRPAEGGHRAGHARPRGREDRARPGRPALGHPAGERDGHRAGGDPAAHRRASWPT